MAPNFSPLDYNCMFFSPLSSLPGRVTPEQLCSYMQLFRSSWGALESHCGVLQLGLATAQTLRHPCLARWDACLAFERLLLQVCTRLTHIYYSRSPQAVKYETCPFKVGHSLLKICDASSDGKKDFKLLNDKKLS